MKFGQSTNLGRGTRKLTGAGHTLNGEISFRHITALTAILPRPNGSRSSLASAFRSNQSTFFGLATAMADLPQARTTCVCTSTLSFRLMAAKTTEMLLMVGLCSQHCGDQTFLWTKVERSKKVVLGLVARHIIHVPASFAITHRPRVRRAVHNPNGVAPQRLQRRRPVHALACVARTPTASAQGDCQRP